MSDRKMLHLNGLRGVAALMVVLSHYTLSFYPALHTGNPSDVYNSFELFVSASPLNVLYNGSFAVFIFFILSGFVLSYKYWRLEHYTFNDYLGNIIKRYIRLNIPIAVSIILAFTLLALGLFYNTNANEIANSLGWLKGIYNFSSDSLEALKEAFYGVVFQGKQNYNLILWTLKYEFYGSVMIYSFMLVLRKTNIRYAIYPLIFVLLWNSYYLAFFLGLLLSDLHSKDLLKIKNRIALFLIFLLALFFGSYPWREQFGAPTRLYGFLKLDFLGVNSYYEFYHTVGAFLLLICALNSSYLKRLLSSRICLFLGEISFSLYLLHLLMLCSLSSLMMHYLTGQLSYNISFVLMFTISMFLLFLISYLYYRFVDLLGIKSASIVVKRFENLINKEDIASTLPYQSRRLDNTKNLKL
ncbi:acyltransferase [Paenibacillus odorifer]|uniref:acyltransferase family protein n=1 Tax=Paenibacillus TaxID=44249 RepID=UPI00096FEB6A|nr:acyltransferase [Paenibacillus odorifer]OME14202.1 hypothetical protein BSK57_28990 [Paenibacillus odorifer]